MLPLRLLLIVPLVLASPSLAQGTKQGGTINRSQHVTTGSRTPVATQPSNNPFEIRSVARCPTASAEPNLNSNRTNVPR